jgi:hypothetical protein
MQVNINLNTIITPDLIKRAKRLGALYKGIEWLEKKPRTLKAALKMYPYWILKIIPELKDDKGIVLEAVKQTGDVLFHASDRLKDDPEIVLAAVKQDGDSLYFASDRLKDDKEVVLAAREKHFWPLDYASDRLQKEFTGSINLYQLQTKRKYNYKS